MLFQEKKWNMKRRTIPLTILIILLSTGIFTNSCDVVDQAMQLRSLSKCEFRLHSVSDLKLGGVNIQEVNSLDDLGITDYAKITAAFFSGDLPLVFDLNVQVHNPNKNTAAMNRLEWILYIDEVEMTNGVLSQRVEIPPNGGNEVFPVRMSLDLLRALSGESRDAVLNFAFNLAGNGNKPTRIMLKARPTIYVGGQAVEYPGYIKIRTEYTSTVG